MATRLGLKVDVDTLVGYRRGVPVLLEQLAGAGVSASFFFAVGPDRSGVAVKRVFTQRGFLGKMIRNRAPATFGLRTMLYGTLLPAPLIVASDPGLVRAVAEAGHEVGVHGWDHIGWHDGVGRMPFAVLGDQLRRAYDTLAEALGRQPTCFAAPGWQCGANSLRDHDRRQLLYASDVRGSGGPFRPRLGEEVFGTPQLPTNLATMDEMWGLTARDGEEGVRNWLRALDPDLNVATVHAEMEGLALPGVLPSFLGQLRDRGVEVGPLGRLVTGLDPATLPVREVRPARLPGRAGWVWCVR
jgi:peptidoglycan/xylan/chitin deacetylase (PgdA/CDA1 family)